jgi:hypothetical protein
MVTIPASQLGKGVYWLSTNVDNKRLEAVKILIQ